MLGASASHLLQPPAAAAAVPIYDAIPPYSLKDAMRWEDSDAPIENALVVKLLKYEDVCGLIRCHCVRNFSDTSPPMVLQEEASCVE